MPRTSIGRWAVALAVVFFLMLVLFIATGPEAAGVWESGTAGAIWAGTVMLLTGVAAAVVGVVSWLRNRDRSWSVVAATVGSGVVTAAILLLMVGELLAGS